MLTLQYAITKEDYINYCTFVAWDAAENYQKRRRYYLKQIGTIVLFTAAFYYTGLFDRSSLFAFIVTGWILLTTIFSMYSARSSIMKEAEKTSNDPGNASVFSSTVVTISETGILLKDEFTESKYQWPAFTKKEENKEYYFLFYSSLEAIIIPKRVFKTSDDTILFEKLLMQFLSFDAEVGHLIKN
jgi:hypothetical protein